MTEKSTAARTTRRRPNATAAKKETKETRGKTGTSSSKAISEEAGAKRADAVAGKQSERAAVPVPMPGLHLRHIGVPGTEMTTIPVPVPELHLRHIGLPGIEMARVPVPVPQVPIPDLVRRGMQEPTADRLVLFGGLAGLAAFGVINWPVAGVVAAGTYVAERSARTAVRRDRTGHERREPAKTSAAPRA